MGLTGAVAELVYVGDEGGGTGIGVCGGLGAAHIKFNVGVEPDVNSELPQRFVL